MQTAVQAAAGQLPTNLPSPPNIRKVNPADNAVMAMAMYSDTLPLVQVSDYADSIVAQQISRIDGVGQVNVGGIQRPAIRVQLDPRKVASLGLQLDAIRTAIGTNTVNAPKGNLISPRESMTVYANDQVLDAPTWNDMIVAYKAGAPVRIKDVGRAIAGVENNQTGAWSEKGAATQDPSLRTGRVVHVSINKAPGANVIRTVEAIKKALPGMRAQMPQSMQLHVIADRTLTIRAAVKDVEITLLITIVLVVAVIFLFLRNVRATVIPSAVIPLSLLATAAVMLPSGSASTTCR